MTTAREYNEHQLDDQRLTFDHITELVRYWQRGHGLEPDGKAGPLTIASIPPWKFGLVNGWLVGDQVTHIEAHPSWFGGTLDGGKPSGIVAHFTDTAPGTAVNMAKRRQHVYGTDPDDRLASWHVTIETDGSVVQMIPFSRIAWHAGSPTAIPVPGLGKANQHTVGVEFVGDGKLFTAEQVATARRVWRVLVREYGIPRQFAMLQHSEIDPTRRDDPGPVWMEKYADDVLETAYE